MCIWIKPRCMPNDYSYNVLIGGYCKNSNVEEAMNLYRDLILNTYSTLLTGLFSNGEGWRSWKIICWDETNVMLYLIHWHIITLSLLGFARMVMFGRQWNLFRSLESNNRELSVDFVNQGDSMLLGSCSTNYIIKV